MYSCAALTLLWILLFRKPWQFKRESWCYLSLQGTGESFKRHDLSLVKENRVLLGIYRCWNQYSWRLSRPRVRYHCDKLCEYQGYSQPRLPCWSKKNQCGNNESQTLSFRDRQLHHTWKASSSRKLYLTLQKCKTWTKLGTVSQICITLGEKEKQTQMMF